MATGSPAWSNQIIWGRAPHVFAVFLIVAASGALNVASNRLGPSAASSTSRWRASRACWRSPCWAGGLAILVLDLGTAGSPDRSHDLLQLQVPFSRGISTSIWASSASSPFNIWMMMERRMNDYSKPVGMLAFHSGA